MISVKKIIYILLFIFCIGLVAGYVSHSIYQRQINDLKQEVIALKQMNKEIDEIKAQYYYPNIGLSKDLQFHTYVACKRYGVDYKLALSVMYAESSFQVNAKNSNDNKTTDYGLMQINTVNLEKFYQMGYKDIMNPYANIEYGVYILSQREKVFDDIHHVVSSYRWGIQGFKNLKVDKTKYSNKIVNYKQNL